GAAAWRGPVGAARRTRPCEKAALAAAVSAVVRVWLRSVLAQLGCVGVGRRPGAQDPSDHDPQQQDAGNVDEVGGGGHYARVPRLTSASRRSMSRATAPRRRETEVR